MLLSLCVALQKLLSVVLPCFLEAVKKERERQVVMGVLDAMNGVIKACKGEALQVQGILSEISQAIREVLKKKVTMPYQSFVIVLHKTLLLTSFLSKVLQV